MARAAAIPILFGFLLVLLLHPACTLSTATVDKRHLSERTPKVIDGTAQHKFARRGKNGPCDTKDSDWRDNFDAFDAKKHMATIDRDIRYTLVFDGIKTCITFLQQRGQDFGAKKSQNLLVSIAAQWPGSSFYCFLDVYDLVPSVSDMGEPGSTSNPAKMSFGKGFESYKFIPWRDCLLQYQHADREIINLYGETTLDRNERKQSDAYRRESLRQQFIDAERKEKLRLSNVRAQKLQDIAQTQQDFGELERDIKEFKSDVVKYRRTYLQDRDIFRMIERLDYYNVKGKPNRNPGNFWIDMGVAISTEYFECSLTEKEMPSEFMLSFMAGGFRPSKHSSNEDRKMDPATAWFILLNLKSCQSSFFLRPEKKSHNWKALDMPEYVGTCWYDYRDGVVKAGIKKLVGKMFPDWLEKNTRDKYYRWMVCMIPELHEGSERQTLASNIAKALDAGGKAWLAAMQKAKEKQAPMK